VAARNATDPAVASLRITVRERSRRAPRTSSAARPDKKSMRKATERAIGRASERATSFRFRLIHAVRRRRRRRICSTAGRPLLYRNHRAIAPVPASGSPPFHRRPRPAAYRSARSDDQVFYYFHGNSVLDRPYTKEVIYSMLERV